MTWIDSAPRDLLGQAKARGYDARLEAILGEGLRQLGIDARWAKGKSILLKPNLVEPRKNAPHMAGIPQSILDLTATVRPALAIIDGIIGMEGDGPLMGTPRRANLLVMGTNLTAVDATAARLMGFDPLRIPYLRAASGRLGPIGRRRIEQRGEPIEPLAQRFELLDHPNMKAFRG